MLDDITSVQQDQETSRNDKNTVAESAISNKSQEPSNANFVKIEQQHCEGQNSPQLVRSVTSNTATSGDYNNYDHLLDNISILNISPSRNDGNIPPPGTTAGTSAPYSSYPPLLLLRLHSGRKCTKKRNFF